jgi:DNA-binding Lrp family transcriptional regulator
MTVRQKDKKQRMILEELLKDGTQSYATIANKLGMHHNTVKKYITEYEKSGIILGYSADLAYENISDMYMVLFRCQPFTHNDYELLKERLDKGLLETTELKVLDSYFTVGEFQAAVIIMADNVFALHRYLNYLINSYDYLKSYVVLQVSRTNQRNLHANKDWNTLEDLVNFKEHQVDI